MYLTGIAVIVVAIVALYLVGRWLWPPRKSVTPAGITIQRRTPRRPAA
jgi:hypothetical protein